MRNQEFKEKMHEYSLWRANLIQSIEKYKQWLSRYGLETPHSNNIILNSLDGLKHDRITLAFVAEFSRGKTELINAMFFAESGIRLLPSSPGRTTMSPTEIFYDEAGGNYIRLLTIESRLEAISLAELKQIPERWIQFDLDCNSPSQMQKVFRELIATKKVDRDLASKLGLWSEREFEDQGGNVNKPDQVEIPCWRHALISFPHPLLKEGLSIIDTPGLNALGTEPELTLNMLPSAQAIIFMLAADTGVTKSDLEIWMTYISRARSGKSQGLAVVMNKIDAMWDDLAETNYETAIQSQIKASAEILKIDENTIFPVSAKQGLLAKVKFDKNLLERSRLPQLEAYLASDILTQKQRIMSSTITRDLGFLINESSNLVNSSLDHATLQLEEFKKIDFRNQEMTGKLMAETRDKQNLYMANVENFQSSRRVFIVQAKMLIDSFSDEKVDAIVSLAKDNITKSLTTYGMKQNIRKLFDELRDLLQDSIDITNETRRLVKAIHKKFKDEYGFSDIEPQLFSVQTYQIELEQVFDEGEAFRSSAKVTMTEQHIVVEKLYNTLISKAKNIIKQAHNDAITWSNGALTPLMQQIKDHKKQIEGRLQMLRKINDSKGTVAENIATLEAELTPLRNQQEELMNILQDMQLDNTAAFSTEE
ncbi:MAG: dynamin family protein [Methylovulum sp.]|jgi:hypothetical protein|nr:dynamin family protein [Methylovulum sp.]MCF7998286.1 dynamin family protein [Methylovulum sp.]